MTDHRNRVQYRNFTLARDYSLSGQMFEEGFWQDTTEPFAWEILSDEASAYVVRGIKAARVR